MIFFCYCHSDRAIYSSLCTAFDLAKIERWDESNLPLGLPLSRSLYKAIEGCDICVFIATERSLESKWCLAELGAFWGANKKVIIFLAENGSTELDIPPQFQGHLCTNDAQKFINEINNTEQSLIQKTQNGFKTRIGNLKLMVTFGRLEKIDHSSIDCLVVLPANEYFDDECIFDRNSSLGAFVFEFFSENIPQIRNLIQAELLEEYSEELEKKPKQFVPSYGIGKCVFLNEPLSKQLRVAMVSVTTQRVNVGLKSNPQNIFEAVIALRRLMANHRLKTLHMPLLGSGHGGLSSEISLTCTILSLIELHNRGDYGLREVNLVVFKENQESKPQLSEMTTLKILEFARKIT